MGWRLKKTVVMVGMMGAGKTAVGRVLASDLGVPFRDSDAEMELAAAMSVSEIFARDGEPFFRRKETQVISRLLDGPPCVLSTGGGAYMSAENRGMITEKGVAVWLEADLDTLWNRVRGRDTRPLLRTADPRATLADLLARRGPVYALADLSVASGPGVSVAEMSARVIEALSGRPDILEQC